MHNKRQSMPKSWPIARKGNVYYTNSSHAKTKGIPVLIALRDILEIVDTAKEAKIMLLNKQVVINGKVRTDPQFIIQLFDILSLEKIGKNFKLTLNGRKMKFIEVGQKDSTKKISKIIGKKIISKEITQLNLQDGMNLITKEKFSVGDSAVISFKDNKLEKILPMKEGTRVFIMSGKHSGKEGKVSKVLKTDNKREFEIKFEDKEIVLLERTLLAIE